MATYYYVNKQAGYNDNHVVHAYGCKYQPSLQDRLFLGSFYTPTAAIQQARKYYPGALGCDNCCPVTVKKNLNVQYSVGLKHMVSL
ncbi:MAG: hypothetical protein QRY16_01440 [Enterobacterales bacterium endosymbiont of Blomia tropicalis]|uniref:hypothetical protein n=1 Tax=Mixta mediterraneensis TaxID=2758443 RepID=UPI0025A6A518|nr:hypothetical protein [Mixta mediterraneensis]MDL4912486.1 hypothetical protein [Mixta mediterraneensis]